LSKTLIFCLRHRCTKNQVLQVFGRIEQRLKSSEVLLTSPPKLISQPARKLAREINFWYSAQQQYVVGANEISKDFEYLHEYQN